MWFTKLKTALTNKFPSVFNADMSEAELEDALTNMDQPIFSVDIDESIATVVDPLVIKMTKNSESTNKNFDDITIAMTALKDKVNELQGTVEAQATQIDALSETKVKDILSKEVRTEADVKTVADELFDNQDQGIKTVKLSFEEFMGIKSVN